MDKLRGQTKEVLHIDDASTWEPKHDEVLVWRPVRAVYTFELTEEARPGDVYRDNFERDWIVEASGPAAVALREPGAPEKLFNVTLRADHPAYKLTPGDVLHPVLTHRTGSGWDGHVKHIARIGFGKYHARPEEKSWIYWERPETWAVAVGPHVRDRAEFSNTEWLHEGSKDDKSIWERIRHALANYQARQV